jgi:hypothetical protein
MNGAHKISPHEGYFFAQDFIEKDDDGREIPRKRTYNVVGKFYDHEMVDCKATEALAAEGKLGRVMRTVLVLSERVLRDVAGAESKDETPTRVTPRNQEALAKRYPEAWEAYQAGKAGPKRGRGRPRKDAGDGGAGIVDLQTARG